MTPRQLLTSEEYIEYRKSPEGCYWAINLQQVNKNPILMDCMRAPEGYKFVQMDFSALEPTVLAAFSGCPKYHELFLSGKEHRVYLYVMTQVLDPEGKIAEIYDLENPTKESIKAAKKKFKREDTIGKVLHLSATYKAGVAKIWRQLVLAGVDITKQEVAALRDKYWGPDLFQEVLNYEENLKAEVQQRGGWMMNKMGRPIAVTKKKLKDVLNLDAQSYGHDCLDLTLTELDSPARALGAKPALSDFHDETVWLVKSESANQFATEIDQAVSRVNSMIQLGVDLKGEPEVASSFTEFKAPDPVEWYDARVAEWERKNG